MSLSSALSRVSTGRTKTGRRYLGHQTTWYLSEKTAPTFLRAPGLRNDDAAAASCQPRGKTIRIEASVQCAGATMPAENKFKRLS